MPRLRPAYIVAGALLVLDQPDHVYGTGTLGLLLPHGGVIPAGVDWLLVYDTEIGEDRQPLGKRHALVRVAAGKSSPTSRGRHGRHPGVRAFSVDRPARGTARDA